MPGPYAVRVRTPDGWQDLAVIGPPGPVGPQGPPGAGSEVYNWFDSGDSPAAANTPGASNRVIVPLLSIASKVSKSDGTNPDFTVNANGTLTIVKAGHYQIAACVEIVGPHTTAQTFVSNIVLGDLTTDPTYWQAIDEAFLTPTQTTPNSSRPTHNHTVGRTFAAGDIVGVVAYTDNVTAAVQARYFSIHKTGTGPAGPAGPTGPQGLMSVYEQPGAPSTPAIGTVWIDTDDPVPSGPVVGPPLVTSLPASPYDQQECYFLADATNGVIWHLRYRAAASGSYKWEVVGGPPLFSEVTAVQGPGSASYVDMATVGPSITLPLAGDYDVNIGSTVASSGSAVAGSLAYMSYAIGGTAASDNDCAMFQTPVAGSTGIMYMSISRVRRKTGLAISTALVAKYRLGFATYLFYFQNRFMTVYPVRVG